MIARVHSKRPVGAKMLFLNLRQRLDTIQSILTVDENDQISKQMLKFATSIPDESLISVECILLKAACLVTGCTVQQYELKLLQVRVFDFG